jgi:hypothetical protein
VPAEVVRGTGRCYAYEIFVYCQHLKGCMCAVNKLV